MSVDTFYYDTKNRPGLNLKIDSLDSDLLWRIRIDEYDKKTRLQEEKYHAMLGDIARQCTHLNLHFKTDDWKRLCVDMFAKECIRDEIPKVADYFRRNEVKVMPALDSKGIVALGNQTRDFPRYVAAAFIEWLYAFGVERDVVWTRKHDAWSE